MFNSSYLRACMKLWIVQKIRFPFLSLGGPSHGAGFDGSAECPIFWAFVLWVWFPYSSFQQVRQPSIPSPVEEDTPKIQDTTGTAFIQGPSIVLPVWRCIMFNGSYLRACIKLQFVKKLDFPFMSLGGPSHGGRVWCLGRVPKHRN